MRIKDNVLLEVWASDIVDGKFIFPEGVTSIGYSAFVGLAELTSIDIPESVTNIDKWAFNSCENLASVTLPQNIEAINEATFRGCKCLRNIKIPQNVTFIGDMAFQQCESLTNITIPKGVTVIGNSAFGNCSSLTSINIPEGVTEIRTGTFLLCNKLSSINIPQNVTHIELAAFYGCEGLKEINLPDKLVEIGEKAFYGCDGLTNIKLPDSVRHIGIRAFAECTNLTSINIPEGVTEIKKSTFFLCEKLTDIEIPQSVTSIGNWAFAGCERLTSMKIPKSVTKISDFALNIKYNSIKYDKDFNLYLTTESKLKKDNKFIPLPYLIMLINKNQLKEFLTTADFTTFNSNINNLAQLLESISDEEAYDFYKFAVSLGCFSREKVLDKNGRETSTTMSQKASALLAKLIKTPQLSIRAFHNLCGSLPEDSRADQDFLDFITPQGKRNENFELLIKLENDMPGIFTRVMTDFDEAKGYRITSAEDGSPRTIPWEEALTKLYMCVRYDGVTEKTKDIASVYTAKGLQQDIFELGVKLREEAKAHDVPEHILGKPVKEETILERIEQLKQKTAEELYDSKKIIEELYKKQFTYEWLNKNDPRNGILGLYVSCCGTISSTLYGLHIAESSITQRDVQNLVINDHSGEIISKGTFYIDEEHGYGVFNDFELNNKYREHETSVPGWYRGDLKDESELTESEKKQRRERDLIFAAYQRGIAAFVEEYNIQHPDKPLQQINVGMGYNRLKRNVEQFEKATNLLSVPIEYGFKDASGEQYILYKRDEKAEEARDIIPIDDDKLI